MASPTPTPISKRTSGSLPPEPVADLRLGPVSATSVHSRTRVSEMPIAASGQFHRVDRARPKLQQLSACRSRRIRSISADQAVGAAIGLDSGDTGRLQRDQPVCQFLAARADFPRPRSHPRPGRGQGLRSVPSPWRCAPNSRSAPSAAPPASPQADRATLPAVRRLMRGAPARSRRGGGRLPSS